MKLTLFILVAGMVLSSTLRAQELGDYLGMATSNNPALQAMYHRYEAANAMPGTVGMPNPELAVRDFGGNITTEQGTIITRISLMQMFPWPGSLKAQRAVAGSDARAMQMAYMDERDRLHTEVKMAWYRLYIQARQEAVMKETLVLVQDYERLATSRYENGQGTMVDVIRAQMETARLRNRIALKEEERKPLLAAFNTLLGRGLYEQVFSPGSLPDIRFAPSDTLPVDVELHPRLDIVRHRLEALDHQDIAVQKEGLPMVGLGVDYMLMRATNGEMMQGGGIPFMPMLTLSLPVYRKKYRAMHEQVQHSREAEKMQLNAERNALQQQWAEALYAFHSALANVVLYEDLAEKGGQAVRLSTTAFANGQIGLDEVLKIQEDLLDYRLSNAEAWAEAHMARAYLDYITGQ